MEISPTKSAAHRIIDRYMRNATADEREEALINLRQLSTTLLRIEDRLARDWYARQTRDSTVAAVDSKLRSSPSQ